jgi:hypothetical protein
MNEVFTFDDIVDLDDHIIDHVVRRVDFKELAKALIGEDAKLRKKFYCNIQSVTDLKALDADMLNTGQFSVLEKGAAQGNILSIIGNIQKYQTTRFQSGFQSIESFESFLTERQQYERPYGIFDNDITMCRFFESYNGEEILADIEQKNEEHGMGNITIPHTKIKLINYSVCPKCGAVF